MGSYTLMLTSFETHIFKREGLTTLLIVFYNKMGKGGDGHEKNYKAFLCTIISRSDVTHTRKASLL